MYITSQCSGDTSKWGQIRDCCTCDEAGCILRPRCNGSIVWDSQYSSPMIDCTRALFIALAGDLADGRIPVKVSYWD